MDGLLLFVSDFLLSFFLALVLHIAPLSLLSQLAFGPGAVIILPFL
jgi:hypothetical protein